MKENIFRIGRKLKVSIIGVIIEGLLSGCNFYVLFRVLDLIFKKNIQFIDILKAAGSLAIIFGLRLIIYIMAYIGSQIGGSDVSQKVRIGLGDKLKNIPLGLFTKNRTGYYINAATSEVTDYEQILTHKLADITKYCILLLAVGIYACILYVPIGVLILLSCFVLLPIMKITILKVQKYGTQKNLAREENVSAITDYLTGSQTLRSYGMAGRKNEDLTSVMKEYSDISYHYEKAILPIGFSYHYLSFIVLALSIMLGVRAFTIESIEPAVLILLIMLALFATKVSMTLYISLTAYRNLMISKQKINRIMDEEEEEITDVQFEPKDACITFQNVAFSYVKEEPVLKDVNFVIKEHSLTAIVGDSGTGKSTILNLISRYYKPQKGCIKIGGIDINKVSSEQVLSQISLVDQNVYLFNDTVKNNIRYARPEATDEEIEEACRMANCDGFIKKMKQGYDTMIGENGNKLSGGERQRLSVARAILKDSPIILLDEATASLDIENELLVKQAISRLLTADKTVVIIAHTLPIIKNADQIIVIANGMVAESGKHDELLEKNGKYACMWKASQALR